MSRRSRRIALRLPVPPEELHYGDIVCYAHHTHGFHDAPVMYISPCGHTISEGGGPNLIDLIGVDDLPFEKGIDHKAPEMWRRCTHV